eukprot:539338-Amorphochlora_amoeboformis.AAC.1
MSDDRVWVFVLACSQLSMLGDDAIVHCLSQESHAIYAKGVEDSDGDAHGDAEQFLDGFQWLKEYARSAAVVGHQDSNENFFVALSDS